MAPKKRSRIPRVFLAPFNPSDILERAAAIGTLLPFELPTGVPAFSAAHVPTGLSAFSAAHVPTALLHSGHTPGVGSAHIPAAVLHPVRTPGVGSADPRLPPTSNIDLSDQSFVYSKGEL